MNENRNFKRINNDWYSESQKKHKRENFFFYFLVVITVVLFSFVIYLLCVS